ncbi:MAG: hypothetical protein ACQGVK_25515 [Myxococcota bacterium]
MPSPQRLQRSGRSRSKSRLTRRGVELALAVALGLAPATQGRADLGSDLIDEGGVAMTGLMDVSRYDGSMPDGAETLLGIDVGQDKALDVGPELENGTDIGFVEDARKDDLTGRAGVIVGDVDEDEVDVRGGFYKGTKNGFVLFGWQMGEPDEVVRDSDRVKVSQSRDVAVIVTVTSLDPSNLVSEISTARAPLCKVKAVFSDKNGTNRDENMPDFGSWKVTCKKGWTNAFPEITASGAKVLKKVLGGKEFTQKGKGPGVDLDQALEDFDLPFL